jgi:outer membrane protein
MKKIILITLFSVSLALNAQTSLTLRNVVTEAFKNNHKIVILNNSQAVLNNLATRGNAGLLPNISLSANTNVSSMDYFGTSISNGSTYSEKGINGQSSGANVSVQYTLFNGFNDYWTYEKLQTSRDVGYWRNRDLIEQTIVGVIKAYYNVIQLSEQLDISHQTLEISKDRYSRALNRSKLGSALSIDLLNAEVDINTDSLNVLNVELYLENAKRQLNYLMGRDINIAYTIEDSVTFEERIEYDNWYTMALSESANLKVSSYELESARIDESISRASYLPKLFFTGAYNYNNSESALSQYSPLESNGYSANLALSYNIFSGYRGRIQRQNAKILKASKEEALEDSKKVLERDVSNAFATYDNQLRAMEIERKHVETAGINYLRTKDLFGLGQVTNTQFREAQLNLARAKSLLTSARYNAKFAEIELLRLSGELYSRLDEN